MQDDSGRRRILEDVRGSLVPAGWRWWGSPRFCCEGRADEWGTVVSGPL